MKKYIVLLITILLLVGCTKKVEKFYLEDEYYGEGIITKSTSDEINKLEEDKENFAVFVYLNSCSSCSKFTKVLEDFSKEYGINFYSMTLEESEETSCTCIKYSPSVAIYKEGKVVAYLDANSDEDLEYYESSETFKEWFTKYVYLKK